MLDLGQLRHHLQALDTGDATSRRQVVLSLKDYDANEWATAPAEMIHALIESLQRQRSWDRNQLFIRKEVMTILGNLGRRSEPALLPLIELMQEGNPAGIRDA